MKNRHWVNPNHAPRLAQNRRRKIVGRVESQAWEEVMEKLKQDSKFF